ncbi:MAG: hypothetical protein KA369_00780 [Spirochaetes bacterium]|nr:hypothetical protein [Spirochaetota bacterium]
MAKITLSVSILMVMILLGNAHGFVEKRHQWWQVHLKNLAEEKARVMKNNALDRQVLGVIDDEMTRAREIIAVFESEMKHDGSLVLETRTMTEADIASEAARTVPPLVALHQFQALVNEAGTGAAMDEARQAVEKRVQVMIQRSFTKESPDLLRRIMDTNIGKDEWKNLSIEYFIGRMMASRRNSIDHAIADITGRVSLALKGTSNRTNAKELHGMTVKAAREYLAECGFHGSPHDSAALAASWTWKRIEASLTRDFKTCNGVISLIHGSGGNPGAVSLDRIMYFCKNPAELESILFKGQHPHLGDTKPSAVPGHGRQGTAVMIEIPGPLRANDLLDEIDRLRRGTIGTLTGREDGQYFERIDAGFTSIISRHSTAVKNRFAREEERIRLLKRKDSGVRIVNEKEFSDAHNDFKKALSMIDGYRNKSMEYLRIVSEGMRIDSASLAEQYRSRFQRDQDYLRFAAALVTECSRLSSFEVPGIHRDFSLAMSRVRSVYNFIDTGLRLEKEDRTHLTKRDFGAIRDDKIQFTGAINSLKENIRNTYGRYGIQRSSSAMAGKKSESCLRDTIAQDEIDGLYRHVGRCVELFEQFIYPEKALFRYAERFNAFMKEARTGSPSKELEQSLKNGSLFSSMEDFDGARIARETATKSYLRKEGKSALARLATLLQQYKKSGVSFKDAPAAGSLAALAGRLNAAPQVKIDSWVMTESNCAEIDAKAIKKLSLLLNRGDIAPAASAGANDMARTESRKIVAIKEPELSLAFPRGWEEDSIGESESYLGIVKSLHSGDGASSVKLVRLALEQGDMKDTAEAWIRKSGCSLVEKRWEKTGDIRYLWILARDKNRNIFETCSVSKDGYAVLITGRSGRDRYVKFKAQFKKIIDSLQMETL